MKYINLHTHNFTRNSEIIEIVNQYPCEFDNKPTHFSIGIHPWKIDEISLESELAIIESNMQNEKCLAIGECGLDKRIEVSIGLQLEVFESQLRLAAIYSKPVILHCVAAFDELIEIKKKLKLKIPIIVHGFSKNIDVAKQLVRNGFYISFGKYLMTNPSVANAFSLLPTAFIFLETDSSDYKIEDIYKKAADIKGITISELKQIIEINFQTVFRNQKKL